MRHGELITVGVVQSQVNIEPGRLLVRRLNIMFLVADRVDSKSVIIDVARFMNVRVYRQDAGRRSQIVGGGTGIVRFIRVGIQRSNRLSASPRGIGMAGRGRLDAKINNRPFRQIGERIGTGLLKRKNFALGKGPVGTVFQNISGRAGDGPERRRNRIPFGSYGQTRSCKAGFALKDVLGRLLSQIREVAEESETVFPAVSVRFKDIAGIIAVVGFGRPEDPVILKFARFRLIVVGVGYEQARIVIGIGILQRRIVRITPACNRVAAAADNTAAAAGRARPVDSKSDRVPVLNVIGKRVHAVDGKVEINFFGVGRIALAVGGQLRRVEAGVLRRGIEKIVKIVVAVARDEPAVPVIASSALVVKVLNKDVENNLLVRKNGLRSPAGIIEHIGRRPGPAEAVVSVVPCPPFIGVVEDGRLIGTGSRRYENRLFGRKAGEETALRFAVLEVDRPRFLSRLLAEFLLVREPLNRVVVVRADQGKRNRAEFVLSVGPVRVLLNGEVVSADVRGRARQQSQRVARNGRAGVDRN